MKRRQLFAVSRVSTHERRIKKSIIVLIQQVLLGYSQIQVQSVHRYVPRVDLLLIALPWLCRPAS